VKKCICWCLSIIELYAFFWVIPRCLKFICRRFRTLCLFHLHRQVGVCRMNSSEGNVGAQTISKPNLFPYNTPTLPSDEFILHAPTCLWRWNRQSVPKRRHINFRRQGITQKKAYYINVSVNNTERHKFTLTYIFHPLAFHFLPVIWESTLEFVSHIIWQIWN